VATFPIRNRILAKLNPETYWANASPGDVPDLLNVSDATRVLHYNASTTAYDPDENWREVGRVMTGTTALAPDYMAMRQVFTGGKALLVQLNIRGAFSYSGGVAKRDLLSLEPVGGAGATDDNAFVLTLVQEEATKQAKLVGQVYESGAWGTHNEIPLGALNASDDRDLYIHVYSSPEDGTVVIDLATPGHTIEQAAYIYQTGLDMRLAQFNSADNLAGNRPDIGLPPETGTSQDVAFCFAANLPAPCTQDLLWELAKVDQIAATGDYNSPLWPYDNSRAELTSSLSSGSNPAMITLPSEQLKKFRAPGQMERAYVTLVDPEDPTINERCWMMNLDILVGTMTLLRGPYAFNDEMRDWPAGTLVRGLLLSSFNDHVVGGEEILPGIMSDPLLSNEPVKVYRSQAALNFAGDTWKIQFPNGRGLMVEEVLVISGTDITTGTLNVGIEAEPDVVLTETVPAIAEGGEVWVASGPTNRKARNELVVTLSGGTGYGYVCLKGAFQPL
jgi:hypothetical protein